MSGVGKKIGNFSKISGDVNSIYWALARTDHQNISGNDTIATLNFSIPSSITTTTPVTLTFNGIKMVDNRLSEISGNSFNALDTTVLVVPVGISSVTSAIEYAMVVPNPSSNEAALHLQLSQSASLNVTVTDMAGRVVASLNSFTGKGKHQIVLPQVAPGIYLLKISSAEETKAIKWIKH